MIAASDSSQNVPITSSFELASSPLEARSSGFLDSWWHCYSGILVSCKSIHKFRMVTRSLNVLQRLLLPRIAETLFARRNLKSHHLSLLRRLTTSLAALKESQAESFSVLPRPESPWKELEPFSKCRTVKDVLDIISEKGFTYSQIPHVTLLRCGIRDVSVEKEGEAQPTTAELFGYLERQISWLATDDGMKFEVIVPIY